MLIVSHSFFLNLQDSVESMFLQFLSPGIKIVCFQLSAQVSQSVRVGTNMQSSAIAQREKAKLKFVLVIFL